MAEVIAVDGLAKRFGAVEALRGVSFTVDGPQVVGVLGPNGAGKTTLLEILQGLQRPTAGRVRLFGAPLDPARYPKRRVGVVLQHEFYFDRITVGDYAELFASIYGVTGGRARIIERADLAARQSIAVARLSGGEQQRLFIAAAAVHDPELLFLDEPTSRLDPASKRQIGAFLRKLGERCTVVLTTHDLREADAVCDHALFLVAGEIKAQGARAALIDAVPTAERSGLGMEDAFFHFCAQRIAADGEAA